MADKEQIRALSGNRKSDYYSNDLKKAKASAEEYKKRKWLIKADEMPWEDSPQGRIKHVVHEEMNTADFCVDVYQQLIAPGERSGKHRHMAEEIFYVLDGKGYDLHWDVQFDCKDEYSWDWAKEPKRFEWEKGDFVYIPPFTMHQHFNADSKDTARFISTTSRVVKLLGFDWIEQVENAPGFGKK